MTQKSQPLRVMFIVPHPIEGPSTRFRIAQYLPHLAQSGIEATLRPLFTSQEAQVIYGDGAIPTKVLLTLRAAMRRMGDVAKAGRYDLVYILREAFPFGPAWFERLLQWRAGRMAFDFDDAIYVPSTAFTNVLDRLRVFAKPAQLCQRADAVVAGSSHLARFAAAAGADPTRISVVPTVVDTEVFKPEFALRDPAHLTVGWIGTPRGSSYLHPLLSGMQRLAAAHPNARFVFVGAMPFDCQNLNVSFPQWKLDREVADLQSFDIGLMPLTDDEEARGKCGFKIIEYMSVGAPVVCSPVGANCDIVEQDRTGLFASQPHDWGDALLKLAADPAMRAQMGRAGRARAVEKFSLAVTAPHLVQILRAAAAGRPLGKRDFNR